jgi:4-carboxymuconolactone decarboxylase
MDNGLTQEQAAKVVTHLAVYAGWPNAMSPLPVAKEVFEKRPRWGRPGLRQRAGLLAPRYNEGRS